MRYPTYLMLVLFAGAAGCAHRPAPAPEKPQVAYGCPVGKKPVHSMGDLIADKVQSAGEVKDISVPELQCSMQGDVLRIDFRDGAVSVSAGELFVVPKGVEHKPYAEHEVQLLLIEPRGVHNTGHEGGDRTAENDVWI